MSSPIQLRFNDYLNSQNYHGDILPNLASLKRTLSEVSEILLCNDVGATHSVYDTAKTNITYIEHINKLYNSCQKYKPCANAIVQITKERQRLNNEIINNEQLDESLQLIAPTGLENFATEITEMYARLNEFRAKLSVYTTRFLSAVINTLSTEELNNLASSPAITDEMLKQIHYCNLADKDKLDVLLKQHKLNLASQININDGNSFTAVGVTYTNTDGSSRQDAIREAEQNNVTTLCVIPYTYQDKPAYALANDNQILGVIPKEIAETLAQYNLEYVFCKVDKYFNNSNKYGFSVSLSAFGKPKTQQSSKNIV